MLSGPYPLRFALVTGALLLTGCASQLTPLPELSWQQHQALVMESEQWSLRGRLNIRSSNESSTVSISWQQQEASFLINLSGAFGMGASSIRGNSNNVVIEQGNEEPVHSDNLSALSLHYLGYEFPADSLLYWLRGIPDPDAGPTELELNEQERLHHLTQQDKLGNVWHLQYDRYSSTELLALPGRIRMQHADYQLTFLINDWQIEENSALASSPLSQP